MDSLLIDRHEGWWSLTLNRPAVKNALNTALLAAVADALDDAADARSCRAVMICGAEGNFAAGADIGEIEQKGSAEGRSDPRKVLWTRIRSFAKPVVSAIDGFALGGGFELALMTDMIVVGETARMGLPETNLGIMPGAGGSQRLMALVGRARATRMVLTGEIIDAATAEAWGIAAWRVDGSAVPFAGELAARLAKRAPLSLAAAKKVMVLGDERGLALAEERKAFEDLLDSVDKREGIAAFKARRKPEFKGE